jgi:hypothetical protein
MLRSRKVAFDLHLMPQAALSVGFRQFKLSLDVNRLDWIGFARSRYDGPFAGLMFRF